MKKKQHYMVVDDDATNNMICEFTIKRVDIASDIKIFTIPEEALAYIRECFSTTRNAGKTVLFLDINLHSMTGWEFLDVFLQFDQWVRDQFTIYILSSSIEDFTEKAAIYPFIHGFLSKPLKIANIEEVRKELLEPQQH